MSRVPDNEALLPSRGWHAPNHRDLVELIRECGHEKGVSAVFDWDNTCIYNDIGEATFRYQLEHLQFRLSPYQLDQIIPVSSEGDDFVLAGDIRLDSLRTDILWAYDTLWPFIRDDNWVEARQQTAYFNLRAKLGRLYLAMVKTPDLGPMYAYPWLGKLLTGYSLNEVHAMAVRAWVTATREPVGTAAWHPAADDQSGWLDFSFRTHIAAHLEVLELMDALHKVGVPLYVVSASPQAVVQGVVNYLQPPIDAAHIFGIRGHYEDDKFTADDVDEAEYPTTYRAGKVHVIERFVTEPPVLVAGDANTDFEMLTHFDETRLRLVINRNATGDIRSLYQSDDTLLQGRDENQAAFRAARETIALGTLDPAALADEP